MKPGSVMHIVGVQCRTGLEEKFQQWYNEVHVPMLLKFPGLKAITQYQITKPDAKYPSVVSPKQLEVFLSIICVLLEGLGLFTQIIHMQITPAIHETLH